MAQDPVLAAHGTDICRLTPGAIVSAAFSDCSIKHDIADEPPRFAFDNRHVRRANRDPVRLIEIALKRSRRQDRFPLRADRHKASVIHLYRDPEALEKALEIAKGAR